MSTRIVGTEGSQLRTAGVTFGYEIIEVSGGSAAFVGPALEGQLQQLNAEFNFVVEKAEEALTSYAVAVAAIVAGLAGPVSTGEFLLGYGTPTAGIASSLPEALGSAFNSFGNDLLNMGLPNDFFGTNAGIPSPLSSLGDSPPEAGPIALPAYNVSTDWANPSSLGTPTSSPSMSAPESNSGTTESSESEDEEGGDDGSE